MSHSTNQHIRALCRASSALALAGAASIGPAHAVGGQDWKGYAGVNCIAQSNNDPLRRSAVNQTALANTGTSTITVFCPVVRDVAEGGDNRVSAVTVHMRNRNTAVSGRCEFSSHDINGLKIDSKSAVIPPVASLAEPRPGECAQLGQLCAQLPIAGARCRHEPAVVHRQLQGR